MCHGTGQIRYKREWAPAEDTKLREYVEEARSVYDIALRLVRPVGDVSRRIGELGLQDPRPPASSFVRVKVRGGEQVDVHDARGFGGTP